MLGIKAPYPTPVIIVNMKKRTYPKNPGGTRIVNVEKTENNKAPPITIHFRTILSARYPKNSIVTPERKVNDAVRIPNGTVLPPKPKYSEIIDKFGGIMFEMELIRVTVAINNIKENFGSSFDFFSMNFVSLISYKRIILEV